MKKILYLVLIIMLYSCEGETNYYFDVSNESNDNIVVQLKSVFGENNEINITKSQTKNIYYSSKMGASKGKVSPTAYLDSIIIYKENSFDTCKLEILNEKYWESLIKKTSISTYKHTYKLNLTDYFF